MTRAFIVGLSLALVAAACASPPDGPAGDSDAAIPDTVTSPVDFAIADLALRIGSAEGIIVVAVEDVTWRDGSFGCPQPGMSYTQALVDGYRIELSDGETTYFYHGGVGRSPFLCENVDEPGSATSSDATTPRSPTAPTTDDGSITTVDETPVSAYHGTLVGLVTAATEDLVARLSVSTGDVVVVSAESVVWPDGSLGCPIPDMRYTQVQVEGAKIVLSVDGDIYNYHSGGNRGPFLCVPAKAAPGTGTTKLTLPETPGTDE